MLQTFHQPHTNLWVAQSELYATNSGIFFSEDQVCLIDPALLPHEIQAIKHFMDGKRLKPDNLLITHHHWDHLFGPEYFPSVRLITHGLYKTALSGEGGTGTLENVQRFEKENNIRRARSFRLPDPDITYEGSMSVQLNDFKLELIHAPGHCIDQMVIHQPDAGILWAADMLSDLEIPFVFESLLDYQTTLEKLNRLAVQLLIPGHGQIAEDPKEIRTRFSEDIAYLAELRQRLEDALQAGWSLEEAQADCENMRFKHPEDNAGPHRRNVETAYQELSGEV